MSARFTTPPKTWEEVMAGYSPDIQALATDLRAVVRDALPTCTESVGGAKMMGYSQYWLDGRSDVLAMISPEDPHVKLYVHHITKDATGALKVEGTGKNARHVKLRDLDAGAVRALLAQVMAARNAT